MRSKATINIDKITSGPFQENSYLLWADGQTKAVLIDPGDDVSSILDALKAHDLSLEKMLCTHGHMDHIAASGELKARSGAAIFIHEDDQWLVDDLPNHCRYLNLPEVEPPVIDGYLHPGDNVDTCGLVFKVIGTPGHTPGGVCFKLGKHLFVGDTLFQGSIGRTDLPGGNYDQLIASIHTRLLGLDDELIVHSGHGPDSTLGNEKRLNPFLKSN